MTPDHSALIERLEGEPGDCPFCGRDPYHYVDNGVGMERVAVTCCDEGIAYFQHGDPVLTEQVALRREAAAALRDLTEWRDIATAPKDGTVIIAMGRYVAATAGFPAMVHFMAGSWRQIGQGMMPSMVCWAWKPRDVLGAWPSEPLPSAPNQAKEAGE